jgi:hypothetical protein
LLQIVVGIIQNLVNLSLLFKWSWTTNYWWVLGLVKWALILSTLFVTPKLEPPWHYLMDCSRWYALPSTRYGALGVFQSKLITLCIICYWETSLDLKRKDLPPPPTFTHVVFIMKNNLLIYLGLSLFFIFLGWRMLI